MRFTSRVLLVVMLICFTQVAGQADPLTPGARSSDVSTSKTPSGKTDLTGNALDETFFYTRSVLEHAFKNLQTLAWAVLAGLIGIEVVVVILKIVTTDENPTMVIATRIGLVIVLTFLLGNYMMEMKFIQWLSINLGRVAAGAIAQGTPQDVAPGPSLLYKSSQDWLDPIYYASKKIKPPTAGEVPGQPDVKVPQDLDFGTSIVLFIATCVMFVPFSVLIVFYFVIYVKYSVLIGLGVIFVPLGMTERTKFLAEGFVSSVVAHGVEILLFNFSLGVGYAVLQAISIPNGGVLRQEQILGYAVTACILAFLFCLASMEIPRLAGKLVRGRVPLGVKR